MRSCSFFCFLEANELWEEVKIEGTFSTLRAYTVVMMLRSSHAPCEAYAYDVSSSENLKSVLMKSVFCLPLSAVAHLRKTSVEVYLTKTLSECL